MTLGLLGAWGAPPDYAAYAALAVAGVFLLVAIVPAGPRAFGSFFEFASIDDLTRRRRFLTVTGFAAAFLSLAYIAYYLRGGPRLDEATAYFLEGRALSHGDFAWTVPEPSASFRGRFLLYDADTHRMAGIFPPGFPMLLAAGFLVGAPMVIGPLIAAGLVLATWFLARELMAAGPPEGASVDAQIEAVGRVAVGLSLVSSALRYHTAETTAHAASALGITLALAFALRARRLSETGWFALAGLAVGAVAATRPASAVPIAVVVAVLAVGARGRRGASIATTLFAMAPGVAVLLLGNAVATGSPFRIPELAYYAVSDGPPGCFRYGFGAGVGCVHEHSAYLAEHQPNGFGPLEALFTTLRRLRANVQDVANFEPLAVLILVPLWKRARENRAPLLAFVVVVGQMLIYAPFYFDGNAPGAGARIYADILPIEHALLAFAVAQILPRVALARKALVVLGLALAGFAVHAVHDHVKLAGSGAGRPFFEPDFLREKDGVKIGVDHGLLFVDNEQAFNLAHVPGAEASHALVTARLRNDDHDRMIYDHYSHPSVHRYVLNPDPDVPFWIPSPPSALGGDETWRFEAEADWPPLAQEGAWAEPIQVVGSCASNERALEVTTAAASGRVRIALPVPRDGRWRVVPRAFRRGGAGSAVLTLYGAKKDAVPLAKWSWSDALDKPPVDAIAPDACLDLAAEDVALTAAGGAWLEIEVTVGSVALDRTHLAVLRSEPPPPAPPPEPVSP